MIQRLNSALYRKLITSPSPFSQMTCMNFGGACVDEFIAILISSFVVDVDYEPVNTTLTFSASMRTISFNVTVIDDDLVEGDETLTMRLEILTVGNIALIQPTAPVTILDDDSEFREHYSGYITGRFRAMSGHC